MDELVETIRSMVLRLVAEVCLREHGASQRLGLGGTDVRFLTLLDLYGPLTPGRLATLTGLTTGSVTGVIDRLERGGFVGRERDDADRRKVRVVPVPEATARLAAEWHDNLDHARHGPAAQEPCRAGRHLPLPQRDRRGARRPVGRGHDRRGDARADRPGRGPR